VIETRELAPHEREILLRMLEAASFRGASELRAQVQGARVVVDDLPTFLDLEVEGSFPPSAFDGRGPIPVRAYVGASDRDDDYEGELLVWVTNGFLSGLEFAWVTDEMPSGMPPSERVEISSD
jgi:hypothetical protein